MPAGTGLNSHRVITTLQHIQTRKQSNMHTPHQPLTLAPGGLSRVSRLSLIASRPPAAAAAGRPAAPAAPAGPPLTPAPAPAAAAPYAVQVEAEGLGGVRVKTLVSSLFGLKANCTRGSNLMSGRIRLRGTASTDCIERPVWLVTTTQNAG